MIKNGVEENKDKTNCFFCGAEVDNDVTKCPKCGATLAKLDISENRNPYTKKYMTSDGEIVEGSGWEIWGTFILIFGIIIFLIGLVTTLTVGTIIASIIFIAIGATLLTIGSYRKHKGKVIVREENEKIREENPEFKSQEDEEDIWDKLKKIKTKNNNTCNGFDVNNQSNIQDQLRNLKSLLDENILTQAEFDKAKKIILEKHQNNINK